MYRLTSGGRASAVAALADAGGRRVFKTALAET
jgi:hypothetical protein